MTRRTPSGTLRLISETSVTDFAFSSAIAVAKALTLTAGDLLCDPALLPAARADFEKGGS